MKNNILIVDDESGIRTFLSMALEDEYEVSEAANSEETFSVMKKKKINLVLLDLILGVENGIDVLKRIKKENPDIAVIMMTAYGDISTSVEAMKAGAFHYLCKPVNIEELLLYINQALEFQHLNRRVDVIEEQMLTHNGYGTYGDIIGRSDSMQEVYRIIDKVKDVNTNVIITGESGTGKELVAREIHRRGNRKNENYVTVNCAAIPEGLLEEEFFGHSKGAFTGAISDRKGKLALADHGTIFLDEIGDMPLNLQGKLLRALQEKEITPIGSSVTRKIDVRIICATNRDLVQMVSEGRFRGDLYYRLSVVNINMPPLRERKEDIPELCQVFINRFNAGMKKNVMEISKDAIEFLNAYDYPGNVRELINMLECACILCDGKTIKLKDFPNNCKLNNEIDESIFSPQEAVEQYLSGLSIREVEKMLISNALMKNNRNKRASAKELGISERSLFYKIQEFNLE